MSTDEPDFAADDDPVIPDDASELFGLPAAAWSEPAPFLDRADPAVETAPDAAAVLDDPARISAGDPDRLLWDLATAGAQVRRAFTSVAEQWSTPPTDEPPRAVLVVTDASSMVAGPLLAHLGGERAAVLDWRAPVLPRWAGPADALFAASMDGRHPRVATIVAEADRRGLSLVVLSPPDSPVAAAARLAQRLPVSITAHRRAALWTMLTPLLLAGRAWGLVDLSDDDFEDVAAALDQVAESCHPATDAFTNPAKQLALEALESDLVLAGCGVLSALAAGWMADSVALLAGIGAVPIDLPDDVAQAGALLEIGVSGAASFREDDFFRDRVGESGRRRRLVVLPEHGSGADPRPASAGMGGDLHDLAAARAAAALHDIAGARGIRSSTPDLPGRTALAGFAAASALGDFTAAYAAIGRGVDPAAVRAGEMLF